MNTHAIGSTYFSVNSAVRNGLILVKSLARHHNYDSPSVFDDHSRLALVDRAGSGESWQ